MRGHDHAGIGGDDMTIDFDIRRLVPQFLYSDRNGYALCMAIQAAFEYVAEKVEEGIAILQDVDAMPEWRLDELAWEYNILYDYSADVETKRGWIRNAAQAYSLYGTPAGVMQYLEATFDSVRLEEWWEYEGDPYHFRVTVDGEYNEENEAWAMKAANTAKNVRSVLDEIIFNSGNVTVPMYVGAAVIGVEIEVDAEMQDIFRFL